MFHNELDGLSAIENRQSFIEHGAAVIATVRKKAPAEVFEDYNRGLNEGAAT